MRGKTTRTPAVPPTAKLATRPWPATATRLCRCGNPACPQGSWPR